MKGDAKVIEYLNQQLKGELTAINQYFLHARMLKNWGFDRLAKHEYEESIEEMKHAEKLIARILFLEGSPSVSKLNKVTIGSSVSVQLENDLGSEVGAVKDYNDGISAATAAGDNGTREMLESILEEEENHIDWLEAQIDQIKHIGIQNYLSQQIEKG